jgi:hypothetical protein
MAPIWNAVYLTMETTLSRLEQGPVDRSRGRLATDAAAPTYGS